MESAIYAKISTEPIEGDKKRLGAFYTPEALTDVICEWAIASSDARVLEPSFGGCGFLKSAAERFRLLGSTNPQLNLYGCDIDSYAFEHLSNTFGLRGGCSLLPPAPPWRERRRRRVNSRRLRLRRRGADESATSGRRRDRSGAVRRAGSATKPPGIPRAPRTVGAHEGPQHTGSQGLLTQVMVRTWGFHLLFSVSNSRIRSAMKQRSGATIPGCSAACRASGPGPAGNLCWPVGKGAR